MSTVALLVRDPVPTVSEPLMPYHPDVMGPTTSSREPELTTVAPVYKLLSPQRVSWPVPFLTSPPVSPMFPILEYTKVSPAPSKVTVLLPRENVFVAAELPT